MVTQHSNTKHQRTEQTQERTQAISQRKPKVDMCKHSLQITDLPELTPSANSRNINHSIQLTTPDTTTQISTIYCPNGKPNETLIQSIIDRNPFTMITGDFNIRHENIGSESASSTGLALIDLHGTQQFHTPQRSRTKPHQRLIRKTSKYTWQPWIRSQHHHRQVQHRRIKDQAGRSV